MDAGDEGDGDGVVLGGVEAVAGEGVFGGVEENGGEVVDDDAGLGGGIVAGHEEDVGALKGEGYAREDV